MNNILHITSHLGGGLGTVIRGWTEADKHNHHTIYSLDYANEKSIRWAKDFDMHLAWEQQEWFLKAWMNDADIVIVHYYDHPLISRLFSGPIHPCRLVFWSHKNHPIPQQILSFPDLFLDVSPVQGHGRHIWSTGGIDRFLKIQPKEHKGFNIGYCGWVDYRKIHPDFFDMCLKITARIRGVKFTMVGENRLPPGPWDQMITYVGQVDDVAPYLAEMDVFGYPLRPDHFGTSEQVLGEAMAAGVVPVVMNNAAERKIVVDGVSGFIGHTMQHYIDHFNYLSNNHRRFSKEARDRAKQLYSLDTMIQKWDEVFTEMMLKTKTVRHTL
jgi:glycosyltransferase involved in cell wall biosynthesis